MCSIFKKGNKKLCSNQQSISLIYPLCIASTRLLSNRISNYCEKKNILPESQFHFVYSTQTFLPLEFSFAGIFFVQLTISVSFYLQFGSQIKSFDFILHFQPKISFPLDFSTEIFIPLKFSITD